MSGIAWAIPVVALMILLQSLPGEWQAILRYEREAVLAGQVWRLLSAGLVHLGWAHLALNAAALLILAWVFAGEHSAGASVAHLGLCIVVCHLGLLVLSPQIYWVVGLSGALHGLFAIGALSWISRSHRAGWLLLAGVIVKVGWEQVAGELPLSREVVGGSIVVDAHLWGLLGGLAVFGAGAVWHRLTSRL